MNRREISYVPGLHKIFDELLVNAVGNFVTMDRLVVTIDGDTTITSATTAQVGPWAPSVNPSTLLLRSRQPTQPLYLRACINTPCVEMRAEEQMYTPELVFGHLYTSSNNNDNGDDDDDEETGGRHGLGAKLANLFSTHFRAERLNSQRRKRFRMEWEHNTGTPSSSLCRCHMITASMMSAPSGTAMWWTYNFTSSYNHPTTML
jgi:DNA topoisomerase-2